MSVSAGVEFRKIVLRSLAERDATYMRAATKAAFRPNHIASQATAIDIANWSMIQRINERLMIRRCSQSKSHFRCGIAQSRLPAPILEPRSGLSFQRVYSLSQSDNASFPTQNCQIWRSRKGAAGAISHARAAVDYIPAISLLRLASNQTYHARRSV